MSSELRAKLEFRANIEDHLRQLGILVGRRVDVTELGPAERVRAFQEELGGGPFARAEEWSFPFQDRHGIRFQAYLARLSEAHPGPVEIVTPVASSCGTLTVPGLDAVRFNFPFDLNEGVISFCTPDWLNGIDLDWERDSTGQEMLHVNTRGGEWAPAAMVDQ